MSVFLLSHKLDGVHDSLDVEDGCIPVTLHLPFSAVTAITRYRLECPDGIPIPPIGIFHWPFDIRYKHIQEKP